MRRTRHGLLFASMTAGIVLVAGCQEDTARPVQEQSQEQSKPQEPAQDEVVGVWQPLPRCGLANHDGEFQVDSQLEFLADGTLIIDDSVMTWSRLARARVQFSNGWLMYATVDPMEHRLIVVDEGQACTFYTPDEWTKRNAQVSEVLTSAAWKARSGWEAEVVEFKPEGTYLTYDSYDGTGKAEWYLGELSGYLEVPGPSLDGYNSYEIDINALLATPPRLFLTHHGSDDVFYQFTPVKN